MQAWTGTTPFIDTETINFFNTTTEELEDLIAYEDTDRDEFLDNVQNLLHNLARLGALIESDAAGTDASEGRDL